MLIKRNKIQIQDIVIIITIASTLLYVWANNMPSLIGSFRYFWAPASLLLIAFTRPNVLKIGFVKRFLVYGILILLILQYTLWSFMSDWNVLRLQEEFYWMIVFVMILAYYWSKKEIHKLAVLSKWAFAFIFITIVLTHIALFFDPLVVRSSVNSFRNNPAGAELSKLYGAASYGYAQSLVILIPVLIYQIKTGQKIIFNSKISIVFIILLILLLIRANVFANVLIAIPVFILSVLGPRKRKTPYSILAVAVITLFLIPTSTYSNFFLKTANYFDQDSFMHNRFMDFAIFVENPEFYTTTQAGGRTARYPLLFEALRSEPFLGDASYNSRYVIEEGGHLYWMNRLTIWGILGFALFVYTLYYLFRRISNLFDAQFRYYYYVSLLAMVGLGLVKSIQGREQWLMLFLIIPGIYYLNNPRTDRSDVTF